MQTIERDPAWPEWAKYYARDRNKFAYVYEDGPVPLMVTTEWLGHSRVMRVKEGGMYGPGLCEEWLYSLCEIVSKPVPSTKTITVVLYVHATTQLHHVPKILRELAERVEREGGCCCCSGAVCLSGSGTDWDWKVYEQQGGAQDGGS